MSINQVTITGNLGSDSELRQTQGGMSILSFSVCVNERKKQGNEWVNDPNWFDVLVFGQRAQSLAQYLVKGTKVAVSGRLSQNRWEKDGKKHSKVEIVANDIEFMTARQGQDDTSDIPF